MHTIYKKSIILTCVITALTLTGCASSHDDPGSPGTAAPVLAPLAPLAAASQSASGTTQLGGAISGGGTKISTTSLPVPGIAAMQQDLGQTVSDGGNTISIAGNGIGRGTMKSNDNTNPVGIIGGNVGITVIATSVTVTSINRLTADSAAPGSPLQPLAPVTNTLGSAAGNLGASLNNAGILSVLTIRTGKGEQTTQAVSDTLATPANGNPTTPLVTQLKGNISPDPAALMSTASSLSSAVSTAFAPLTGMLNAGAVTGAINSHK